MPTRYAPRIALALVVTTTVAIALDGCSSSSSTNNNGGASPDGGGGGSDAQGAPGSDGSSGGSSSSSGGSSSGSGDSAAPACDPIKNDCTDITHCAIARADDPSKVVPTCVNNGQGQLGDKCTSPADCSSGLTCASSENPPDGGDTTFSLSSNGICMVQCRVNEPSAYCADRVPQYKGPACQALTNAGSTGIGVCVDYGKQ
jgi:hypothetical protein